MIRAFIRYLVCIVFVTPAAAFAQSPNTATLVVTVHDESGAIIKNAAVSVVNSDTGATRETVSGDDGTTTVPALALTGTYIVSVTKQGFKPETIKDLTLRAGETAALRVKLVVGGERSDVTAYGTADGVRANPQLSMRLDSQQIDETPLLGRKITSLPLLNSAFRSAKGTGDLFVNATYFVTGVGGRRQAAVTITAQRTMSHGAAKRCSRRSRLAPCRRWPSCRTRSRRSSAGPRALRSTSSPRRERTRCTARRSSSDARAGCRQRIWARVLSARRPSRPVCHRLPMALRRQSCPRTFLIRSVRCRLVSAARSPGIRTHYFAAFDYTHQDRTAPITSPLVAPGTTILGKSRQTLFDGRVDHKLSPAHRRRP